MSKNNDVVILELDRPRELRYGHKALKMLTSITGMDIDNIEMESTDLGQIEKVIYCGLLSDAKANGEQLKLEDMEDLLDQAPTFAYIVEKMQEALAVSFGSLSDMGNQQQLGENPATNGTGKQA